MNYEINVKEQKPIDKSILCMVTVGTENVSVVYGGQMYFVCNLDKQITQYFEWQKREYKQELEKLGYKF